MPPTSQTFSSHLAAFREKVAVETAPTKTRSRPAATPDWQKLFCGKAVRKGTALSEACAERR